MIINSVKIFSRLQQQKKVRYVFLLNLFFLLSVSLLFYPIQNATQHGLQYQKYDLTAKIQYTQDLGSIDALIAESEHKLANNFPRAELLSTYVDTVTVFQNDTTISPALFGKITFEQNRSNPLFKIPDLWRRDPVNQSVSVGETTFDNPAIMRYEPKKTSLFDVQVELPMDLQQNFTHYLFGLNLPVEDYSSSNTGDPDKKLESKNEQFKEVLSKIWLNQVDFSSPVISATETVSKDMATIQIQNLVLFLTIIGGLTLFILYLQVLLYRDDMQKYITMYQRGYAMEHLKVYFPAMFVGSQMLLSVILNLIISIAGSLSFGLTTLVPTAIIFFTAILAVYYNTNEIEDLEPKDATDIKIEPTYLEYIFLGLTIISALANIAINLPHLVSFHLLLILSIYLGIGVGIAFILYQVWIRFSTIIKQKVDEKDSLDHTVSTALYLIKILRRKTLQNKSVFLIFGVILVLVGSQFYISFAIFQYSSSAERSRVWGQYQRSPDLSGINLPGNSHTASIVGAELNQIGLNFKGLIGSITALPEIYGGLDDPDDLQAPMLYLSDTIPHYNRESFLSYDNNIKALEGNYSTKISFDGYQLIPENIRLPNNPEFLLLLPKMAMHQIQSPGFLIVDALAEKIQETVVSIERQTDSQFTWMSPPRTEPISYTLQQNLTRSFFTSIITTFVLFSAVILIIGFVRPSIHLGEDIGPLLKQGLQRKWVIHGFVRNNLLFMILQILLVFFAIVTVITIIRFAGLLQFINITYDFPMMLVFSVAPVFLFNLAELGGIFVLTTQMKQRID